MIVAHCQRVKVREATAEWRLDLDTAAGLSPTIGQGVRTRLGANPLSVCVDFRLLLASYASSKARRGLTVLVRRNVKKLNVALSYA